LDPPRHAEDLDMPESTSLQWTLASMVAVMLVATACGGAVSQPFGGRGGGAPEPVGDGGAPEGGAARSGSSGGGSSGGASSGSSGGGSSGGASSGSSGGGSSGDASSGAAPGGPITCVDDSSPGFTCPSGETAYVCTGLDTPVDDGLASACGQAETGNGGFEYCCGTGSASGPLTCQAEGSPSFHCPAGENAFVCTGLDTPVDDGLASACGQAETGNGGFEYCCTGQ
jgi:hypothetical protein